GLLTSIAVTEPRPVLVVQYVLPSGDHSPSWARLLTGKESPVLADLVNNFGCAQSVTPYRSSLPPPMSSPTPAPASMVPASFAFRDSQVPALKARVASAPASLGLAGLETSMTCTPGDFF